MKRMEPSAVLGRSPVAAWLETSVLAAARDLEAAGRSVYRFEEKIRAILESQPVTDWEADRWLRGVHRRMIRMEDYFYRAGAGKKSAMSLFVRSNAGLNVGMRREALTQIAAYVSLITDYGFPRRQTRFETGWMDVAVFGSAGDVMIYAESKAAEKVLLRLCQRLEKEFETSVPYVDVAELKSVKDDAVMKANHIWRHRPRYFWAVSPTLRRSYEVNYFDSGFSLRGISELPRAFDLQPIPEPVSLQTI